MQTATDSVTIVAISGSRRLISSVRHSLDVTLTRNGATIIMPSAWPGYQFRQTTSQETPRAAPKAMALIMALPIGAMPPAMTIKTSKLRKDVRLDAPILHMSNKTSAAATSTKFATGSAAESVALLPASKLARAFAAEPPTNIEA